MNNSSIEIYRSPEGTVELDKNSTYAKFAYVPDLRERSYETAMYNLDIICP